MGIHGKIKDFISLAVLESSKVLSLQADTAEEITGEVHSDIKGHIKVFYKPSQTELGPKKLSPQNMLFRYNDISENFESYLRKWFENANNLKPMYDLYFSIIHSSNMYVDHKFLSLMQALETYHRRILGGNELSENHHNKRILEILTAVPDQYRQWLEEKLKYSNELSLRKRMKELLGRHSDVMSVYISDLTDFKNKAVDTRNYMTHYDLSLKDKASTGIDLWKLVIELEILVEVCLLSETGFTDAQLKNLFQRTQRYKFLNEATTT